MTFIDDNLMPVELPAARVDYTQVLRGEDHSFKRPIGGVLVGILGYFAIMPVLVQCALAISWAARGTVEPFLDYVTKATKFVYLEGLVFTHLGLGFLIVLSMVIIRVINHRSPRFLTSVQPGMRWRYLLVCFLACAVVMWAINWLSTGAAWVEWNPPSHWPLWLLAILATSPLQAAGEEYLLRGYLIQAGGSLFADKWAVVLGTSALFAIMHGAQNFSLFLARFGFGLVAGSIVVLTGGLEAAIAAHSANNVIAFTFAMFSGTLVEARTMTEVGWVQTGWNLLAYILCGAVCVGLGKIMTIATTTPDTGVLNI